MERGFKDWCSLIGLGRQVSRYSVKYNACAHEYLVTEIAIRKGRLRESQVTLSRRLKVPSELEIANFRKGKERRGILLTACLQERKLQLVAAASLQTSSRRVHPEMQVYPEMQFSP